MDRQQQLRHLAEAERHVAAGVDHIVRLKEIITDFERRGDDTAHALDLLVTFQQSLRLHREHVAQIRRELLQGEFGT